MSSIPTPSPNRQTTQAVSTTRQQTTRQNPQQQFNLTQRYGADACYIIRGQYGYEFGGSIPLLALMQQELRPWVNGITATTTGSTNPGPNPGLIRAGTTTTTGRKPMSQAARAKLSAAAIQRAQVKRAAAPVGTEGHTEPVSRGRKQQRAMGAVG